ncbi:bifunctional acetate--CoA ligase family protein/GNAT family N-acetyltransferase [Nocardioides luteus]|uniref:bifunctional acetate--CoA ligase family protein/GNAT family N-acetyltransferase n=1 Tax=Nocardioides luteus TaxID=1844 RepID=UPI0015A619F8|nr:bifunctional GNAT family N-acetyltransferase/acetate--CoA ligase family protein [Nocardioides luteus]
MTAKTEAGVERSAWVDVLLQDGTIVRVRDAVAGDRGQLVDLHLQLSDLGRYRRFFHVGHFDSTHFVDQLLPQLASGDAVAKVAVVDGRIVALASATSTGDGAAELGLVVADQHAHRGLATLLLEHLAFAAAGAGITELVAYVLADNAAVFDVLRHVGFEIASTPHQETVEVRFPIRLTDRVLEAMITREQRADADSLRALLRPRSVAVIGASRQEDHAGHQVVRNLLRAGFTGKVYPVNPHCDYLLGLRCHGSIREVAPVDLAVVAVPAAQVLEVVRECADSGVRDLVILSSGFAEDGPEGCRRQDEMLAIARGAGMRVVGPNCLGIANTDPEVRLDATFSPMSVGRGTVAMMAQSGAVGIAVLQRAEELGVGLSAFISSGNKADVSCNDLLMYAAEDEATDVVALYLESFGNPRKFSRLARRLAARKPIVALIGGSSHAGRQAAIGHTASAVTSSTAVDALFQQCGVIGVQGLEQLLQTTSVLANQPLPAGRRVGIISNAGGPGVLAADACESVGLSLATLSAETMARIRDIVPDASSEQMPVDLGSGVGWEAFSQVVSTVAHSGEVDMLILMRTPLPALSYAAFARALRTSLRAAPDAETPPVTTVAVMLDTHGPTRPIRAGHHHVPVFAFPEDAARALGPIATYAEWRAAPRVPVAETAAGSRATARDVVARALRATPAGGRLAEPDVRQLLAAYGIGVLPSVVTRGVEEAVDAAAWVGYPVAVKIADPDLVHRTDVGGVRLGLTGPDAVRAAARELLDVPVEHPGLLVQRQVAPGIELIAGVTHDKVFGPLVMVGYGGIYTELIGDRSFRLTPLSRADAASALAELRTAPLLSGYRGAPPQDVAAVEHLLVCLGRLAEDIPEIAEIDLNPVIVHERGVSVVDAKVRLHPAVPAPDPDLRRLSAPIGQVGPLGSDGSA